MEIKPPNTSFSASRPEKTTPAEPINELPRAVLRPSTYLLLDGEWKFTIDPGDVGLRERWYVSHAYTATAQWPGSIETHMAQAKDQSIPTSWQDKIVAWYERDFTLPERSEPLDRSIIQLTFGACGYETRVWLNGYPLSTVEEEEVHFGEYTSFSYELPDAYLRPQNRLTVRIADAMDAERPRANRNRTYINGGASGTRRIPERYGVCGSKRWSATGCARGLAW